MLSKQSFLSTTRISWTLFLIVTVVCLAVTCNAENDTDANTEMENSTQMRAKDDSDESTELETKEEPFPSVWSMMYDLWNWAIGGNSESKYAVGEPRTFGKIRRLQMALIPIVFKFGVISAMVTVLVFLALKTVFLLKMLLLLNAGAILAKILTHKNDNYQQQPSWTGYNAWSPATASIGQPWAGGLPQNKEIHLHIHGGNQQQHGWDKSDYPVYSEGRYAHFDAANELNNPGPLPYLRAAQPNHRTYYTNTVL